MKNLTLDQKYKVIAGASNAPDFESLLQTLIDRVADVRIPIMPDKLGQESAELRKAVIIVLQDSLDTLKRTRNNGAIKPSGE